MKMLKASSHTNMIPTLQYFSSLKKVKISGYTLLGKCKVWDGREGEAIFIDDCSSLPCQIEKNTNRT